LINFPVLYGRILELYLMNPALISITGNPGTWDMNHLPGEKEE